MPYITDKKIFLVFLAIILLAVFGAFLRDFSFPDTSWPLGKGEKTKMDSEIVQKLKAKRDGLSRVKILFGSSDVSPGGTFSFSLLEEDCEKTVREVKLEIKSLKSDNTTDFVFPKIENSKDKTYCLKLSYAQKKGGKKAQVFVIENPKPENLFFSINGEEMAGKGVPLRPAYKNATLGENIKELNRRISQYKPWFLKAGYLHFIAFGFVILSVLLVAIIILL